MIKEKTEANGNNGMFYVKTLGIVFNTKTRKILIGRREEDPHVKNLTWSFPGGRTKQDIEIEEGVEEIIKEKTGLNVKSLGCISSGFARIPNENKNLLLLYYLCELLNGEEKPSSKFKELKWVSPEELENYFTTTFDPRIKEYILNLR